MKKLIQLIVVALALCAISYAQGTWNGGVLLGGKLGVASTTHTNIVSLVDAQGFLDALNVGRKGNPSDTQGLGDALVALYHVSSGNNPSLIDAMSQASDALTIGKNVDFVAALPQQWIDIRQADPPGGTYDQSFTVGPAESHGYTCTITGLQKIFTDFACNFDHAGGVCTGGGIHYADQWWHVTVPHTCTVQATSYPNPGTSTDLNAPNAVFLTGKLNPSTGAEPTKYLVFESDAPLPANQMPCAHGLPGFGGTRNPGCPVDQQSMWGAELMAPISTPGTSFFGGGMDSFINTTGPLGYTWSNHVVFRDLHVFIQPGAAQSGAGTPTVPINFGVTKLNAAGRGTGTLVTPTHIGFERIYVHGNDPGDPGQPAGACTLIGGAANAGWKMVGTANVAADGVTVTWVSGNRFGMTFLPGATWQITSATGLGNYIIAAHDPAASDTTFTLRTPVPGAPLTAVTFSLINPPFQYANGCGDDAENLIKFNTDYSWIGHAYFEKSHWANAEAHTVLFGFSNGPNKFFDIWSEGTGSNFFSGGGPIDTNGGPVSDMEMRRVYLGRDLNYRQLSANAGNSPSPPFGCGPLTLPATTNTCPFQWSVKNSLESKFGSRLLFSGFILDGSWADGQSGYALVQGVRAISGGPAGGIFDATGAPATHLDNVHYEHGIIENSTQGIEQPTRSSIPSDGGGISKGVSNIDYYNLVFVNDADANASGASGTSTELIEWALTSNQYFCGMSRTANVAHANCRPIPLGFGACAPVSGLTAFPAWPDAICKSGVNKIASITRASGITKVAMAQRDDPTVGGTFVINNPTTCVAPCTSSTWTGTFTVRLTYQGNTQLTNDGILGDTFDYVDNRPDATLCTTVANCTSAGFSAVIPTHAYEVTDIGPGDNVYVPNTSTFFCAGGTAPTSYAVGFTSPVYAVAPTNPVGTDVYYANAGANDSSGSNCWMFNGAGYPKHARFHNITVASTNNIYISQTNSSYQSFDNRFYSNIFATSGAKAILQCPGQTGEGTNDFVCFDANSFDWYGSTLQGRAPSSWSVYPATLPTSAPFTNVFPASATCAGSGAGDATCIGWQGYVNGNTFPTTPCPTANAPFNCPLLGPPWSPNFQISKLKLVAGSPTLGGANIDALTAAMNTTQYVCPAGTYCGPTGPFSDNHVVVGPAIYNLGLADGINTTDALVGTKGTSLLLTSNSSACTGSGAPTAGCNGIGLMPYKTCSANGVPGVGCTGPNTGAQTVVVDPLPLNVSTIDLHTLLYAGATTLIWDEYQPWFCNTSSPNCNGHDTIGMQEANAAQVLTQAKWMKTMGVNVTDVDYYGCAASCTTPQSGTQNYNLSVTQALANAIAANPTTTPKFAIMIDGGAVNGAGTGQCPPASGDQSGCLISAINLQMDYLAQNWLYQPYYQYNTKAPQSVTLNWTNQGTYALNSVYRSTVTGGPYTKIFTSGSPIITYTDSTVTAVNTYFYVVTGTDASNNESANSNEISAVVAGHPMVLFFIGFSAWPGTNFNTVFAGVAAHATKGNSCGTSCTYQLTVDLLDENAGAFSETGISGGYGWPQPLAYSASNQLLYSGSGGTYLSGFYTTARANPSQIAMGVAYKGFDDSNANWGSDRVIAQRCGQTWLNTWAQPGASGYSSASQLQHMQIATFNDYEEATASEMGIDNCYRVGTPSISGTTISWSLNPTDFAYATNSTINSFQILTGTTNPTTVFASGIAPTATSFTAPTAHGQQVWINMIGAPGIQNQLSAPITIP